MPQAKERAMIFDLSTLTAFHTLLSLVAIVAGAIAVAGLFNPSVPAFWVPVFLVTAIATSVTGFGFPFNGLLPSHIVGAIALLILAAVVYARRAAKPAGVWRWINAAGMVFSLYLLMFVGVAQAFMKIPVLKAAAPTSTEPPFVVSQIVLLVFFVVLALAAGRKGSGSQ
jgi:hypothetical protein